MPRGGAGRGQGRHKDEDLQALHDLIDRYVSPADWGEIFAKAAELAKAGNVRAMEFLADRRHGKAAQTIAGDPERPVSVVIVDNGEGDESSGAGDD